MEGNEANVKTGLRELAGFSPHREPRVSNIIFIQHCTYRTHSASAVIYLQMNLLEQNKERCAYHKHLHRTGMSCQISSNAVHILWKDESGTRSCIYRTCVLRLQMDVQW